MLWQKNTQPPANQWKHSKQGICEAWMT